MSVEPAASATEDKPILQCPVKFLPNFEGMLYLTTTMFKFVENGTGKKFVKTLASFDSHLTSKDTVEGQNNWLYPLKLFFVAAPKKDAPPSTEVKLEAKTFAFQTLPDRSMISTFLSDHKLASIANVEATPNSPIEPHLPTEEKRKRKHKDDQSEKLARAKVTLLARHDDIKTLYDKLVPDVVSDAEFWENKTRARLVQNEANKPDEQRRAVSWSLQDPTKDQNGVTEDSETITITPEYCQREFVRNPRAYEAYKANVPDKMSEDKFWTLYRREVKFQKEGKPEKATLLQKPPSKDDDKPPGSYHSTKLAHPVHPSIDLQSLLSDDSRYVASFPLTKSDSILSQNGTDLRKSKVLDKCNRLGELFQQEQLGHDRDSSQDAKGYIQELQEDIVLTELREEESARYNSLSISQNLFQKRESKAEVHIDTHVIQLQLSNWSGGDMTPCLPSSDSALQCIKAVSQSNRNMYRIYRGTTQGNQANQMIFNNKTHKIGDVFAFKLKQLSQKSFELFRHYWSCVPTGSALPLTLPPQTEQKLARVTKCLESVHDELESLRSEINANPDNAHLYELTRALDGSLSLIFGAIKNRAEAKARAEARARGPTV